MTARFTQITVDDLIRLGKPHRLAITIYVPTTPDVVGRAKANVGVRSALNQAIRELREAGLTRADEEELRSRGEQVLASDAFTGLSRSLAIFIADDAHEVFVLPNELASQLQVGCWFDIGQLTRAVLAPQQAFALTLSSNGWALWSATGTHRAEPLELVGEHPTDLADATNRATTRDRGHVRRLVGDEGKKVLGERYVQRVAEAVTEELRRLDPNAEQPLFVLANEPLLSLFIARGVPGRTALGVPGASDELTPDEVDAVIRRGLTELNSAGVSELVEQIGHGTSSGLVATDLSDIATAVSRGAVDTLVYEFTHDVAGHLDPRTGRLSYDESGYDLLSRLVTEVLQTGGSAVPVRADEVSAPGWNGVAIARLRHALV